MPSARVDHLKQTRWHLPVVLQWCLARSQAVCLLGHPQDAPDRAASLDRHAYLGGSHVGS